MNTKTRSSLFISRLKAQSSSPTITEGSLRKPQYIVVCSNYVGITLPLGVLNSTWYVELQVDGRTCSRAGFDFLQKRANQIESAIGQPLDWNAGRSEAIRSNVRLTGKGGYSDDEHQWPQIFANMTDAHTRFFASFEPHLAQAATLGGASRRT